MGDAHFADLRVVAKTVGLLISRVGMTRYPEGVSERASWVLLGI